MSGDRSLLAPEPGPLGIYSDAAKRLSDTVNMHMTVMGMAAIGKWVAARLSDGGSDGTLYDNRADAVRHQLHETQCAYICIPGEGMSPKSAEIYLQFNRRLYDNGARMTDPDGPHIHMPLEWKGNFR